MYIYINIENWQGACKQQMHTKVSLKNNTTIILRTNEHLDTVYIFKIVELTRHTARNTPTSKKLAKTRIKSPNGILDIPTKVIQPWNIYI